MCARPGSARPRSRKISVNVSARLIGSSRPGAELLETAQATPTCVEENLDAGVGFPSCRKIAAIRSSTVSASATTRSGSRTPHASPSRSISSTRSRLPRPSSRSRCAFEPRAANSSLPRALPSSVRIWRTTAMVSSSTAMCRASFVPVADKGVASLGAECQCARVGLWLLRRDYHSHFGHSMPQRKCREELRKYLRTVQNWTLGLSTPARPFGNLPLCSGATQNLRAYAPPSPHAHERPAPPPAARFLQPPRAIDASSPF